MAAGEVEHLRAGLEFEQVPDQFRLVVTDVVGEDLGVEGEVVVVEHVLDPGKVVQHVVRRWTMPSMLPATPRGVHEFRENLTKLLKRGRHEGDFPVEFVGAYRRVEGVFMSPKRYEQLLEAENLVEDIGLAGLAAERDDGRSHEGTTADFLAKVEQRTT